MHKDQFRHFKFLGKQYRANLAKSLKNLFLALEGTSPYRTELIGIGMRLSQAFNALIGRSRFRTTSAWCGYRLWGSRPPKFRYFVFVLVIDAVARWVFGDIDHCFGAAVSEGYL